MTPNLGRIVWDPDRPPTLEAEPLAGVELTALAHWRRFLPRLTQQLEAQSPDALPQAIRRAWWTMEYEINLHLARAPELHRDQILELYRPVLFPPPEPSLPPGRARPTST